MQEGGEAAITNALDVLYEYWNEGGLARGFFRLATRGVVLLIISSTVAAVASTDGAALATCGRNRDSCGALLDFLTWRKLAAAPLPLLLLIAAAEAAGVALIFRAVARAIAQRELAAFCSKELGITDDMELEATPWDTMIRRLSTAAEAPVSSPQPPRGLGVALAALRVRYLQRLAQAERENSVADTAVAPNAVSAVGATAIPPIATSAASSPIFGFAGTPMPSVRPLALSSLSPEQAHSPSSILRAHRSAAHSPPPHSPLIVSSGRAFVSAGLEAAVLMSPLNIAGSGGGSGGAAGSALSPSATTAATARSRSGSGGGCRTQRGLSFDLPFAAPPSPRHIPLQLPPAIPPLLLLPQPHSPQVTAVRHQSSARQVFVALTPAEAAKIIMRREALITALLCSGELDLSLCGAGGGGSRGGGGGISGSTGSGIVVDGSPTELTALLLSSLRPQAPLPPILPAPSGANTQLFERPLPPLTPPPSLPPLLSLPYTSHIELALTRVFLAGAIDAETGNVNVVRLRDAAHAARVRWRLRCAGALTLAIAPIALAVGLALQIAAVLADARGGGGGSVAPLGVSRCWVLRASRAVASVGELPHDQRRRMARATGAAVRFLAAAAPPLSPAAVASVRGAFAASASFLASLALLGALSGESVLANSSLAGAPLVLWAALAGAALAATRGAVIAADAAEDAAAAAGGCRRRAVANMGDDPERINVGSVPCPTDLHAARVALADLLAATPALARLPGMPLINVRGHVPASREDIARARAAVAAAFLPRLVAALGEAVGGLTAPLALLFVLPPQASRMLAAVAASEPTTSASAPLPQPPPTALAGGSAPQDGGAAPPTLPAVAEEARGGRSLFWAGMAAAAGGDQRV